MLLLFLSSHRSHHYSARSSEWLAASPAWSEQKVPGTGGPQKRGGQSRRAVGSDAGFRLELKPVETNTIERFDRVIV